MLHIDAIKITIYTNNGLFGRTLNFNKGLNIIRANNTSGKSSLYGAIIYGLGFEELLGSRNERALQSVFKSIVKELTFADGKQILRENIVTQSEIFLQITNGSDHITTKRYIINEKVKPQAIEVFKGKLLSETAKEYDRSPMFIHDPGSASNTEIGFHKYLEEFIGGKLPEIINQDGRRVKLYLPLISSVHFIEQKSGWSDFFANIPYYGVRDANSKVFEYILNLDVFEKAAQRQEIQNRFRDLDDRWKKQIESIRSITARGGGEIVGISEHMEILSSDIKPYIKFYRGDKTLMLTELIEASKKSLNETYQQINIPIQENINRIEKKLSSLKEQTDHYEILFESLSSELSQEKERFRQYNLQLKNVIEDLKKNKDAQKIQNLGLASNLEISSEICPTCNQNISDSLLSESVHIIPMRIDENIEYLNAQQKMVEAFINNLRENILEKQTRLSAIEDAIRENRQKIRSLRRDLTSDDRLPSEELIEQKVVQERELTFLYRLREDFENSINHLYILSKEFAAIKSSEANISKDYHSSEDLRKIDLFENSFKKMLAYFGFASKPVNTIKISNEKYTPVYELKFENGVTKQIDIRFESSASDFIRAQWAYYTSLMKTSSESKGNHFQTLIFDEPQQQSAATNNLKAFLEELEKFEDQQVIVLASFQNSEEDFIEATKGLTKATIIDFAKEGHLIIERISKDSN